MRVLFQFSGEDSGELGDEEAGDGDGGNHGNNVGPFKAYGVHVDCERRGVARQFYESEMLL